MMTSQDEGVKKYILSLDIGTTSMRCFVYDKAIKVIGKCRCKIEMLYPEECAVELNPDKLWDQILFVIRGSLENANITADQIASMGISTQRATFILWDKETGKSFHDFIVWQDTRADNLAKQWNSSYMMKSLQVACKSLHTVTQQNKFLAVAVLRFRAQHVSMRLLWLFQRHENLKRAASEGKVCFGTLDTWIIWKLTNHKVFVTEYSCASATGLYDPYTLAWSGFVCGVLGIPIALFPPVLDTSGDFGECDPEWFGSSIPIRSAIGDQQAAMFGQCCFSPGDVKLTIGTGAFLDLNVGTKAHASVAGFYPVIGWKIGPKIVHLAEGCSNTAGNAVDWLEAMNFIRDPSESELVARQADSSEGVYFVPGFNGIQAPINDYRACGSIMGITQKTRPCHIVRAALESLAFRNKQLFDSLRSETNLPLKRFVCDGGVSNSDMVVQLTSDLTGRAINVPEYKEMSALGAAYLAGLAVGYWSSEEELKGLVKHHQTHKPNKKVAKDYEPVLQTWCRATKRSLNWYKEDQV